MADDNLIYFTKFVNKHRNQLVLDTDRVNILIGLAMDDEDYYWRLKDFHGKEIWASCVGKMIPLKGTLKKEDYEQLEHWFKLNDLTQSMSKAEIKKLNKFSGKILI
jgi:hypothetical protein